MRFCLVVLSLILMGNSPVSPGGNEHPADVGSCDVVVLLPALPGEEDCVVCLVGEGKATSHVAHFYPTGLLTPATSFLGILKEIGKKARKLASQGQVPEVRFSNVQIIPDVGLCYWDPGPPSPLCEAIFGCNVTLWVSVRGLNSPGIGQIVNHHAPIEISGTNVDQTEVATVGIFNREKLIEAYGDCPCKEPGEEAKECKVVIKAARSKIEAIFKCGECQKDPE